MRRRYSPHELPDEAEHESLVSIDDVGALDTDEMHAALLAEVDNIVAVLDLFEARQLRLVRCDTNVLLLPIGVRVRLLLRTRLGLADAAPDDRARHDAVEGLKKDDTVAHVLEQVEDRGLDAKRVEPKCEDARLALALGVEVLDNAVVLRLLLIKRCETGVVVEQIGDEGKVQTRVTGDERGRR